LTDLGRRIIGLLTVTATVAAIAAVSWRELATTRQTGNNVPAGELVAGRRLGQTFHAPFSGLYRLDVLLATYARENAHRVLFHLSDAPDGPSLVTIEMDASRVRDNTFHRLVFQPIPDSANRQYYFYFEAPDAVPGNAITIWQTDFDSYPGGQVYIGNRPAQGDLAFVAYYRSSPAEVWSAFSDRVRTWHPLLWRARWLVLGAAVVWVAGIGLLLGEVLAAGRRHE
jgi:hypothetical protein